VSLKVTYRKFWGILSLRISGSAREFGETTNWRGLEHFCLPGISEVGIQALIGRSEASDLLNSEGSESLESWSRRIVLERWWSQPLILRYLWGGFAFGIARLAQSQHPIELARELAPRLRPRCGGPCRSSTRTKSRQFPQAAAIEAREGRKTGEHWRQLTSEVVETQSARRSNLGKPNKTGGLYRFLLRAHYSTPA
jgi:hypothetical protein